MSLNQRSLEKLQRDTGFNPSFLEKYYHISIILCEIFRNSRLAGSLTLKGGTALNFIYLNSPRLSVDIDLNFTGALEKESMQKEKPEILEELQDIAEQLGYEIRKGAESYIMERMFLKYKTVKGIRDSIKVEINYLERTPFIKIVKKDFNHLFDIQKFIVNTYTIEELAAMKTKALFERMYARDLFDIHQISGIKMKSNVLRKLMILYVIMARKQPDPEKLASKIMKYDNTEIIRAIGPFLNNVQTELLNPETIKTETIEFCRRHLVLEKKERKFIELINQGKVDLAALFDKIKFNPKAQKHPSLLHAIMK